MIDEVMDVLDRVVALHKRENTADAADQYEWTRALNEAEALLRARAVCDAQDYKSVPDVEAQRTGLHKIAVKHLSNTPTGWNRFADKVVATYFKYLEELRLRRMQVHRLEAENERLKEHNRQLRNPVLFAEAPNNNRDF